MINPQAVTIYDRNDYELEEFAIFSVCVAGKNAQLTAKAVNNLLSYFKELYKDILPLKAIAKYVRILDINLFSDLLWRNGIYCQNGRAYALYELAQAVSRRGTFLRDCTIEELENIKGIGAKTARFFIVHSRPNVRCAALDTHILKWLKASGVSDVPKSTPPKKSKKYYQLENIFLSMADQRGLSPANLDLRIWNYYSKGGTGEPIERNESVGTRFKVE